MDFLDYVFCGCVCFIALFKVKSKLLKITNFDHHPLFTLGLSRVNG